MVLLRIEKRCGGTRKIELRNLNVERQAAANRIKSKGGRKANVHVNNLEAGVCRVRDLFCRSSRRYVPAPVQREWR